MNNPYKDVSTFMAGWLFAESTDKDTIKVKKIYIDINDGYLTDGLMFSQMVYWHGLSKETGKIRLKVYKNDYYWLAKQYSHWYEECRINEHTARKAIKRIEDRGLIFTETWKFEGSPTKHIRINWKEFQRRIESIRPNRTDGSDTNGQMELSKTDDSLTETTTETTTEIKKIVTPISSGHEKPQNPLGFHGFVPNGSGEAKDAGSEKDKERQFSKLEEILRQHGAPRLTASQAKDLQKPQFRLKNDGATEPMPSPHEYIEQGNVAFEKFIGFVVASQKKYNNGKFPSPGKIKDHIIGYGRKDGWIAFEEKYGRTYNSLQADSGVSNNVEETLDLQKYLDQI